MKKLIIALVLGIGMTCMAQETPAKSNRGDRGQMQNMTPEQRVQKQVEKMTKDLSLDAKQQEAVSQLLTEKSKKMQDARAKRSGGGQMTDDERKEMRTAMQAERQDTDTKLKAILNADQFKKYSEQRAQNEDRMRERMRERRDDGGFGGNNGGGGFGGDGGNN